jgi:hypothetical protein
MGSGIREGCVPDRPALASPEETTCAVQTVKTRSPLAVIYGYSAAALVALAGASGCWSTGGSKTPEEARARLQTAVASRNPDQLWRALDLDSQWSWMTTLRAGRESYDITLSHVPEGPQRDRLIRRFEPAATSQDAAELFARSLPADTWPKLAAQLAAARGQTLTVNAAGTEAELVFSSGRLVFRKSSQRRFGWGFAGLADQANELKRAASADLEALRNSAADYERAAARGLR